MSSAATIPNKLSRTASIPLWARHAGGRVTLANGEHHAQFQNGESTTRFLDRVHPDDRDQVEALLSAVQEGVSPPELEYRLRVDSNAYRWIIERSLPKPPGGDNPGQFMSVAFDVTARKQAALRLHESEQRFRDIAEFAGDWIWETDANLRYSYLSDRFYKLFDLVPEDIIGKRREEFAGANPADQVWREHLDDLANRRPIRAFEYAVTLPDGSRRYFEINGKPHFDQDGALSGYRGTGKDRTAEVEIRKALDQGERQFRNLVEGSIQGLYIHQDWKILFANQALADMFGYENPDALLALGTLEPLFHPEERNRLWDYKEARNKGDPAPEIYEARCLKQDGSLMWAEFRVKQVEWHGQPATQCAVIDITDRKNAEETLRRQNQQLQAQNERFNAALDNMSQGLCMFDVNERLMVCNDRYVDIYALPRELAQPGTPFREIINYRIESGIYSGGDPRQYTQERLSAVREADASVKIQELTDGRLIAISHTPMPSGGWVATHEDITQFYRLNERLDVALNTMCQGLCMFDKDKRLVVCNKRYLEMYDLPTELSAPGTPFRKIIEHRVQSGVYSGDDPDGYIHERLAAVEEHERSTKIQKLTNGRVIAIVHQPMASGGWLATHEDITELQRVQEQIAHMAHHDALTNLPNRSLLRERVEQALTQAKRGKDFAVLCLDLDRFKSVNDTLGHPVGDEVLKGTADRLCGCVREFDTIARLGGDEFAIIQLSDNQPHDSTALARRICDLIKKPFDVHGHQVVVDTSIGIAVAPSDGLDADQLLKNADMALYRAKSDGRGVYRYFEAEMDAHMQTRRRLELDLRKGLEQGEFELYYQPLVTLESGDIAGFEALLRWHHPERGMIPPDEFIPIAEEIGLIIPLGEWVIRTACAQAAAWPANTKVAVNLSPAQFRSENLVQTVFSALATAGIAAGRLELEITETVLLNDTKSTLETLHQLHDLGVLIAMDDFGTGYSSLSYLRSFPFDRIKIDGSFVSDLSKQEGANAIVDAVASLSRSMGMATTAEGVETQEQLDIIRSAGYTEMQGYLFSPPRSAEEITKLYYPPEPDEASA